MKSFRTGFVFGRMYNDLPADQETWRKMWEEGEEGGGQLLDHVPVGLWVRYETDDEWMGFPIGVRGTEEDDGPQLDYVVCSIGKVDEVFRAEIELARAKWNLLKKQVKAKYNIDIGDAELLFVHDFQ